MAEGIKALRSILNESQQQFSSRLGISISTIARYEVQAPPQGTVLVRLAAIANDVGRNDLEDLFTKASEASADRRSPVAEAIRSLRAATAETQQEFAQRAGLSVVSVARYETNALPKKAVLARLAVVARDLGRNDLQRIFEQAHATDAKEQEDEETVFSFHPQMGTPAGADFFKRISERRLKRIRKLFSKEFHSEQELSAVCAAAWLVEHYSYFNERDEILVDEIKRVLERRAIPLTAAELDMLGELGRRALDEKVKGLPMSQAVGMLREYLDLDIELLAGMLQTTASAIEEFEVGSRAPGKQELEVMLWLTRKTIHKIPELELAFSVALKKATQTEGTEESRTEGGLEGEGKQEI